MAILQRPLWTARGHVICLALIAGFFLPQVASGQILDDWGEVDVVPQIWYNRVDGLHAGAEVWVPLAYFTEVTADVAYKTALRQPSYGIQIENKALPVTIGGTYRNDTHPRYASRFFTRTINGVYTLLSGTDYYDYYEREGATAFLEPLAAFPTVSPRITYRYERHRSLARQTSYDLFGATQQPPNPAIDEGILAALEARLRWEPFRREGSRLHLRRVEVTAEHGDDWLGSDFQYTRFTGSIDGRLRFTEANRSPQVKFRLQGGTSIDGAPAQRFGIVETAARPFAVFGGMRTGPDRPFDGERFGSAFWELNLRGTPLQAIGLTFLGRRWDVYVHGGHAWTEVSEERREQLGDQLIVPRTTPGGGVHELGFGIGRIFRILRTDFTWRLDEPDFAFRVSLTSPF